MKKKIFSAHEYWLSRNRKPGIRTVGLKTFSDRANDYGQRPLFRAFQQVLKELHIDQQAPFLDAGAGIGVHIQFLDTLGYTNLTAVDLSADSLGMITAHVKKIVAPIEDLSAALKDTYEVVYCFDVLYHVIDDDSFQQAIGQLCAASHHYIIIHGMFPRFFTIHLAQHVKFRKLSAYDDQFRVHGFTRTMMVPTHFVMWRLTLYKVYGLAPRFFSWFDQCVRWCAQALGISKLSSHFVIVYERLTQGGNKS